MTFTQNCTQNFTKLFPIAVLLPSLLFPTSVIAEEELSARERFNLCSAFPLNSRCEGYTAPVALKQRPGKEMVCHFNSGTTERTGKCKLDIDEGRMTVYQEYGEKMDLLDDRRDTKTIEVLVPDVSSLQYRETTESDLGETIGLTLLFGLPGFLLSSPDKFAEISVEYIPEGQNSSVVMLIVERDDGPNLKNALEQLTGLEAKIILESEDSEGEEYENEEAEEPAPEAIVNPTPEPTDLESFCESFPENSRCISPENSRERDSAPSR